ncbi:hypothetical protein pdam_00021028 [Pocillopora damicornis]|uniref:Translation initiation factor IF-2, mitochondrial n=1 Tax=Pocillopora damicornis TaxID=46731 RepID=A0A3M6UQS1_POCDA|nr:hypothetical protein pdam_00021028 [Pocillopora damicornis]
MNRTLRVSLRSQFLGHARTALHRRWQHSLPQKPGSQLYIALRPGMTIRQLAAEMSCDPGSLADILVELGEELPNGLLTVLSPDQAELLVMEHNMTPVHRDLKTETRPPVVTIMGHVDHGKTTLLDTLRRTSVVAGEAGGITQHIGAFSVSIKGTDKTITFIDTPGHAAFETMRARGANVTDIVVLVVAADEGVKQQTVESIRHATRAKVPIIVALNKIDKPRVNVEQVKKQLLQYGIQLEEFGGDIQAVAVSALKGTNFDELLEAIHTLAELQDLKAKVDGPVEAIVLESGKDKGRGSIATILVNSGTLRIGDILLCNQAFAKVRLILNDHGQTVTEAMPSTPVEVGGWRNTPSAGDEVIQVETEEEARDAVEKRKAVLRQRKLLSEDVHNALLDVELSYRKEPAPKQPSSEYDCKDKLNIIIKGDVDGSLEAISDALKTYKSKMVKLTVLSSQVGTVTESDIKLAETFHGIILGFNVKITKQMLSLARQRGVDVKQHRVIYKLLEDVKAELNKRITPIHEESVTGEAAVLKVFKLTGRRKATVAGCQVKTGTLDRKSLYRITRNNEVVYEGRLASMKHGVDDISQAKRETECGLSFEKFLEVQEGDVVQCYTVNVIKPEIDWDWGF